MSVNRTVFHALILLISTTFLLLGVHNMDMGHNLRIAEEMGYPLEETNLNGESVTGAEAYRQGFLWILWGVFATFFTLVPYGGRD